jgi:hypothetical protein
VTTQAAVPIAISIKEPGSGVENVKVVIVGVTSAFTLSATISESGA